MGRRTTRKRWFGLALVGVTVATVVLPYVIAASPLRNVVVGLAVAPTGMQATVSDASFGWFSPLSVDGLRLTTSQGDRLAEVGRFSAEMSWWKLALARPDLGHFQVDRPHVELLVRDGGTKFRSARQSGQAAANQTTLSVAIRDGSFLVRRAGAEEPIVRLEKLNVSLRIERSGPGRVLTIEPTDLLDHQRLTRSMCNDGLQLIAPVLADAADVEGEISLRLDELRIPIDTLEGRRIRGRLQLHAVEAGLKDSWLAGVVQLVGVALKTDMPTMVRITDNVELRFHVKDDRVYHEGLAFGLPDVSPGLVIRTQGSVGFDESLDLKVDIPGLQQLVAGRIGGQFPNGGRLEVSVGGTLDHPEISLPDAAGSVAQLLGDLQDGGRLPGVSAATGPLVDDVLQGVGELLRPFSAPEDVGRQPAIPLAERLWNRSRQQQ